MSIQQWHADTLGAKVVGALKKNNFDAHYFPKREEAVDFILTFISPGAKVGLGGSMTLNELMLTDLIENKGANLLNHSRPGLTAEEKVEIRRQQLVSDVFISSSNALTLDGYLVNIDGTGNRVAAMTFGPKKVLIVVGVNKIAKDTHSALERIQLIASPQNNKRLDLPNPCAKTGYCMDCQGETRICNAYSIIKKKPTLTDISVVVIGEKLGY